jgi:hypothetical protein
MWTQYENIHELTVPVNYFRGMDTNMMCFPRGRVTPGLHLNYLAPLRTTEFILVLGTVDPIRAINRIITE